MIVDNQIVAVKHNWKTKDYWENLGYTLPKKGIKFFVQAKDLPTQSNVNVAISCDKCGNIRIGRAYRRDTLCKSCSKKGTNHSKEHIAKISKTKREFYSKNVHPRKGYKYPSPQEHPSWNPNLTDEDRENRRSSAEYREWTLSIKERDAFTCQICSDNKGGNLVSHHIESYRSNKELRFELANGICLCDKCHKQFHGEFGYGNNTSQQWEEFTMKRINNG